MTGLWCRRYEMWSTGPRGHDWLDVGKRLREELIEEQLALFTSKGSPLTRLACEMWTMEEWSSRGTLVPDLRQWRMHMEYIKLADPQTDGYFRGLRRLADRIELRKRSKPVEPRIRGARAFLCPSCERAWCWQYSKYCREWAESTGTTVGWWNCDESFWCGYNEFLDAADPRPQYGLDREYDGMQGRLF